GHGIDTDVFRPGEWQRDRNLLISVGRLSPSKHYELMIEAMSLLTDPAIRLDIVGDVPKPTDAAYRDALLVLIRNKGLENRVRLLAGIPHSETVALYQRTGLFLNLSTTGSLDKAVLEAMACGSLVLTSNDAFVKLLPPESFISDAGPASIAHAIDALLKRSDDSQVRSRETARSLVVREHSLDGLVTKIIKQFQ
ncbi:MAG: glycosyltransferase family 4 protein, partial [Patescibacteria group bacterium]